MEREMRFAAARELIARGPELKLFPGAAAGIMHAGISELICHGHVSDEPDATMADPESIYDVASVTKPVVTTTAILHLAEKQSIELDAPVGEYLDELRRVPDKSAITIRSLLTHVSGLPAWIPLYAMALSREGIIDCIASRPLNNPTGSHVEYSCLGFLLLAEIVRRVSGTGLAEFSRKHLFEPLAMRQTMFHPPRTLLHRIAPTELGNIYEKKLCEKSGYSFHAFRDYRIRGEVHDGNAWFAGGEGGNAGVFSTVVDLMTFGAHYLAILKGHVSGVLTRASVRLAVSNRTAGLNSHRGLGWQMADACDAVTGILPDEAFGHNGFTGTSLWIDPISDSVIVLLTNRVYYPDNLETFKQFRREFHRLVFNALLKH